MTRCKQHKGNEVAACCCLRNRAKSETAYYWQGWSRRGRMFFFYQNRAMRFVAEVLWFSTLRGLVPSTVWVPWCRTQEFWQKEQSRIGKKRLFLGIGAKLVCKSCWMVTVSLIDVFIWTHSTILSGLRRQVPTPIFIASGLRCQRWQRSGCFL